MTQQLPNPFFDLNRVHVQPIRRDRRGPVCGSGDDDPRQGFPRGFDPDAFAAELDPLPIFLRNRHHLDE